MTEDDGYPLDRDEAGSDGEFDGLRTPDGYHRGVVTRIYYGSESGVLKSDTSHREFKFKWPFVEIRGATAPHIDGLREGMVVGFDLAWTSGGERVSVIKVYD